MVSKRKIFRTFAFVLPAILAVIAYAAGCASPSAEAGDANSPQPPVDAKEGGLAVTIFNENLAMVKDTRTLTGLKGPVSVVEITGIPSAIFADSVHFKDLDNRGVTVIEQNYEFDLAGAAKILDKYKYSGDGAGQTITLLLDNGSQVSGLLIYYSGGETNPIMLQEETEITTDIPRGTSFENLSNKNLSGYGQSRTNWAHNRRHFDAVRQELHQLHQEVDRIFFGMNAEEGPFAIGLKTADGTVMHVESDNIKTIRLGDIPENMRAKPTLVWKLDTRSLGEKTETPAEISYLTEGMSWRADYRATFSGENTLDLAGWVTVNNFSGVAFPEAKLKLIAGEVHRVIENPQMPMEEMDMALEANAAPAPAPPPGFTEKAFAEYHLYTLGRPATLASNETKQIELLNRTGIKWEKRYEYDQNVNSARVMAVCVFQNWDNNNLGMPLPAGVVRFYAPDTTGETEYASEDSIDHTPKDEEVRLRMGMVFDIVVEKKALEQTWPSDRAPGIWKMQVKIRNHYDKAVTVEVFEHLPGGYNFEVLEKTHLFEKKDAYTLKFPVKIEGNSEAVLEYKIRFWQ
jgi:hypothetical protein